MDSFDKLYALPRSAVVNSDLPKQLKVSQMFALILIGGIGGAFVGGLTNSFNGAISPWYFRRVMGWAGPNIWQRPIGQGLLEGAIYGFVYAVIFVVVISAISNRRCRFRTALKYIGLTFAIAVTFWFLGGLTGVAIEWMFPSSITSRYFQIPPIWPRVGYYAWVRGSILGVIFGGMLSVLTSNGIYYYRNRNIKKDEFDQNRGF